MEPEAEDSDDGVDVNDDDLDDDGLEDGLGPAPPPIARGGGLRDAGREEQLPSNVASAIALLPAFEPLLAVDAIELLDEAELVPRWSGGRPT